MQDKASHSLHRSENRKSPTERTQSEGASDRGLRVLTLKTQPARQANFVHVDGNPYEAMVDAISHKNVFRRYHALVKAKIEQVLLLFRVLRVHHVLQGALSDGKARTT